jgi:hypothetical protein
MLSVDSSVTHVISATQSHNETSVHCCRGSQRVLPSCLSAVEKKNSSSKGNDCNDYLPLRGDEFVTGNVAQRLV